MNLICLFFGHNFEKPAGCKVGVISNQCFRCGHIEEGLNFKIIKLKEKEDE
jgi:hypothetical protein